jgi:hypothetical protein
LRIYRLATRHLVEEGAEQLRRVGDDRFAALMLADEDHDGGRFVGESLPCHGYTSSPARRRMLAFALYIHAFQYSIT